MIVIIAVVFEVKLTYLGIRFSDVFDDELILANRISIVGLAIHQLRMIFEISFQLSDRSLISTKDIVVFNLFIIPNAVETTTGEVKIF